MEQKEKKIDFGHFTTDPETGKTVFVKPKRGGARPGSGRKVTPYKIPLNVRITQEAADMIADIPAKSEYIDGLIKKDNK